MIKKSLSLLLAVSMIAASFIGCGSDEKKELKKNDRGNTVFKAFFATPGRDLAKDNRVQKAIEEKVGATCEITWLSGQDSKEAVGTLITSGDYPDFIDGDVQQLIKAEALEPIDEHWDDFPNIKKFFTAYQWEQLRQPDGHIYIIPQFDNFYKKDCATNHKGEAFWVQNKVLKWDNYPKIKTLDQYFDLLERYIAAHPKTDDGQDYIGYEILCTADKFFPLENPPFFLDGYPNDGCCIIDPNTVTAIDYNTTDTANKYFKKLNEEYKKGIVDKEAFTMTYEQYKEKIAQGRVLGMCDQYWQFQEAENSLKSKQLYDCEYIPCDVTIDESVKGQYYNNPAISVNNGLGVCRSTADIDAAFKFIDDLLSPEVMKLRFWGEEGTDYLVKEEDGKKVYYRTPEQRRNAETQEWADANLCQYSYFPYYAGECLDDSGNAYSPNEQPGEYYDSLSPAKKECLDAYGVQTLAALVEPPKENKPWFPMWSYTNGWNNDTEYGRVKIKMDEIKHQQLPLVVRAEDFNGAWDTYMKEYKEKIDVKCYLDALTEEAQKRNALYEKFKDK